MNYLFTNAKIYPQNPPGKSVSDSLLVAGDRIACLGSRAECRAVAGADCEVIDLGGSALLPAFTDTHTHFTEYAKQSFQLDLNGCRTLAEIAQRIERFIARQAVLPDWILGGGWDKNSLDEPGKITSDFLDRYFPHTPVALFSKDYHSRWCNSLALDQAGFTASTPDPAGGKILRGPDGVPTGIVTETASELLEKYITQPSPERLQAALRSTLPTLYNYGLTTLHSMESELGAGLLRSWIQEEHALRICRHFPLEELDRHIEQGSVSYAGNEWFQTGGVKIFADGSLGSQTAAIDAPYPGSANNTGILRHSAEELLEIAEKAHQHGIGCVIHAIGNLAVGAVIEAFHTLRQRHPESAVLQRIEHLQSIRPQDLPKLLASRAYCSLQPVHLANDIPMIESLWPSLRGQAYNFGTLNKMNIPFGFGSDAPIETLNPFHGIYTAVTRRQGLDPSHPAWRPEERLSALEALHAYTLGAAGASRAQTCTGSLTPGKLADLIVLEDFECLPDTYWLEARSLLTLLAGDIVHNLL